MPRRNRSPTGWGTWSPASSKLAGTSRSTPRRPPRPCVTVATTSAASTPPSTHGTPPSSTRRQRRHLGADAHRHAPRPRHRPRHPGPQRLDTDLLLRPLRWRRPRPHARHAGRARHRRRVRDRPVRLGRGPRRHHDHPPRTSRPAGAGTRPAPPARPLRPTPGRRWGTPRRRGPDQPRLCVNDHILAILDKGHTGADAADAVTLLRSAGIEPRPSLLPFTPWTTPTGLADLVDFAVEHHLVSNIDPVHWTIRLSSPTDRSSSAGPSWRPTSTVMTPARSAGDGTPLLLRSTSCRSTSPPPSKAPTQSARHRSTPSDASPTPSPVWPVEAAVALAVIDPRRRDSAKPGSAAPSPPVASRPEPPGPSRPRWRLSRSQLDAPGRAAA